jgi:hypothetical protein
VLYYVRDTLACFSQQKRGPSWKTTATTGWPNARAYRDGTHPRDPHADKSRTRPSAPTSSPVGRRRRRPRLTGATLEPAVHAGRRDYDIAGGTRVASRETHREGTILRGLSAGGAPSRLQPKAPGDVFRQAGYSAGLTRFGRFPEGRSAACLLAQEHTQTTSYGYGYKWARFLAYCGTSRCPLPASVETIGCYLGYLFRQGRVTGTSIRPYVAAIRAMHTRGGFPSPTEVPVNAALLAGYTRATADRVTSRPRSVALPAALGHLALTRAIRSRRPTIDAAIAIGFLLAPQAFVHQRSPVG